MPQTLSQIARGWFAFLQSQFTTNGKQDVDLHDLQRRITALEKTIGSIPSLTAELKASTDPLVVAETHQGP